MSRSWFVIVTAIWLMLIGAIQALALSMAFLPIILGVLLILAGLFLLIGK
mgnify:CR=1 FL=1